MLGTLPLEIAEVLAEILETGNFVGRDRSVISGKAPNFIGRLDNPDGDDGGFLSMDAEPVSGRDFDVGIR